MKINNLLSHDDIYSIFKAGYQYLIDRGSVDIIPSLENSFITSGGVQRLYDKNDIGITEKRGTSYVLGSSFQLSRFEKGSLHVEFEKGELVFVQFDCNSKKFNQMNAVKKLIKLLENNYPRITVSVDEFKKKDFDEYYQIWDSDGKLIGEDSTPYHSYLELKEFVLKSIDCDNFVLDNIIQDNHKYIIEYPYFFV